MNTTPSASISAPDARFPYFINPAVDALAEATGEQRSILVRFIAANIGDEATLRSILGIDPEEFRNFYPDMQPPSLSTEDTIDSFINRFSSESAAKTPEIEEIVQAPVVDYASLVAAENQGDNPDDMQQADATSDAISAFLAAVPPKTADAHRAPRRKQLENNESGAELSEALFKLMVKNKNYRKALEIINELSLKNPKKSIYFAYQTRFLEKLIKNQENAAR